jgi:photosystem II stability/assembly factor-like uncharacterized protein
MKIAILFFQIVLVLIISGAENNNEIQRVIYAVVLGNDSHTVGDVNTESGLFRSYDGGASWEHTGWKNIRGFGVAINPESEGREILIAAGNGIHKTINDGASWRLNTDWRVTEILAIATDRSNPAVVYIATAYGPYVSKDSGESWTPILNGLDQRYCSAIHIDRDNTSVVYLGGEGGLYRTTDAGESWELYGFAGEGVRTIAQHPVETDMLYIGTEHNGIYRTSDRGDTWEQINNGILPEPIYVITLHHDNSQIAYAGGWESGIYKTLNGGRSWSRYTRGLDRRTVMSIAIHPDNPDVLYAAMYRGGIYRSTNGGLSWTHAGLGIADVWKLIIK